MRPVASLARICVAMMVLAGCASTNVSNRQVLVDEKLPRPDHILVYDFVATPADVPADSALAGQSNEGAAPQTAAEVAAGRKLGAQIAQELVQNIRGMGLPAETATASTSRQINDIVIRGYLLSVHEGDAAERMTIGFGAGGSELRTAVEGFQVTAQGLRKLGSGTVDASGSKTPGSALGVASLLATANPAGLIVSTGMKAYGEASGDSTVDGRVKQTAKEISDVLENRFQDQGWID